MQEEITPLPTFRSSVDASFHMWPTRLVLQRANGKAAFVMKITCTCGRQLSIPETWVGSKGKCPHCGRILDLDRPVAPITSQVPIDPVVISRHHSCPYCKMDILPDTETCPYCGISVKDKVAVEERIRMDEQKRRISQEIAALKTHLTGSICAFLIFPPVGVVAIIFSLLARERGNRGNLAGAQDASAVARSCIMTAAVLFLLAVVIAFSLGLIAGLTDPFGS